MVELNHSLLSKFFGDSMMERSNNFESTTSVMWDVLNMLKIMHRTFFA